jgi:hypothetical protein
MASVEARHPNGVPSMASVGPAPGRAESPNPYQVAREELRCQHRKIVVVKVASNGARSFREQCPTCGEDGATLRGADLSARVRSAAPPWDESLAARHREAVSARFHELAARDQAERDRRYAAELAERERQRAEERAVWFRWYSAYLLTPEWRRRRAAVLKRDGGICQACLVAPATQVHHLTYQHVGREPLFELTSVCDACHDAIHDKAAPAREP